MFQKYRSFGEGEEEGEEAKVRRRRTPWESRANNTSEKALAVYFRTEASSRDLSSHQGQGQSLNHMLVPKPNGNE